MDARVDQPDGPTNKHVEADAGADATSPRIGGSQECLTACFLDAMECTA